MCTAVSELESSLDSWERDPVIHTGIALGYKT